MPDDALDWNWRRNNLPPIATIFPTLGTPSTAPMTETGVPNSSPNLVRPYTAAPPQPAVGPGYTPNLTAPGVTGVKMPSGMPLGDFGNPAPTAASGKPAETDAEAKARILKTFLDNKDFMGGLAALAKASGGAPQAQSHVFRVSSPSHISGGKDLSQAGGNLMAQALAATREDTDLRTPLKRKGGERDRYDILNKRQGGLKELLAQLG